MSGMQIFVSSQDTHQKECSSRCNCCRKVEVIEKDLAILKSLFVGGNLLVEGDLLVKGRITDEQGGFPRLGPILGCFTTGIAGQDFHINGSPPSCTTILQRGIVTGPESRVFPDTTTTGTILLLNDSTLVGIAVFDNNLDFVGRLPAKQSSSSQTRQGVVTYLEGVATSFVILV